VVRDRFPRLATVCLGLLATACQHTAAPPAFNYAANLGLATQESGHNCIYITSATISPGQQVQFITASTPQTVGQAEIIGKAADICNSPGQDNPDLVRYSFKVTQGAMQRGAPAFALANVTRPLTVKEDGVTADLDGDGQPEYFRSCTSSEGVHLTVWKGKPLEGARKWHSYYYLGYDVTPDCTDSDTKPDPEH
jgi:hypothetical protein